MISQRTIRFRHPDYDPDRAQKLVSSSMSRHLSTRKMSSKSMHAFLSNLADSQTDRQTSRAISFTSSVVGGKLWLMRGFASSGVLMVFPWDADRWCGLMDYAFLLSLGLCRWTDSLNKWHFSVKTCKHKRRWIACWWMNDISKPVNLALGYLYLVVMSACYLPYLRTVYYRP